MGANKEHEKAIIEIEMATMKELMAKNNDLVEKSNSNAVKSSNRSLGLMLTLIVGMFASAYINTAQHSHMMLDQNDLEHWTHEVYRYQIIPADSLSKINSKRLDIQSEYGYRKVYIIDSVLNLYYGWINRNSHEIKIMQGDTGLDNDFKYKSIVNKK